jgi:DNA-binding winged helix-turn-helix (wHTH) protein
VLPVQGFRFAAYTLRLDSRQLFEGTRNVHLSPKAFDLLRILVEAHPSAVSKSDLQAALWPGVFVSRGSLPLLINELRTALGDPAFSPRFIRTVPRFGYAFQVAPEALVDSDFAGPAMLPAHGCWLQWESRTLPLAPGSNILGRGADASVAIDAPGVSRRHAEITLVDGEAAITDLGSKNGTFVEGRPLTGALPLRDGYRIQLGTVVIIFRMPVPIVPTETIVVQR